MSMSNFFADPGTSFVLTTNLDGAVNNSQTSITVINASNFPSKGKILIESELIIYDSKTGNVLNDCYRSNPVSHLNNTSVTLVGRTPEAPIQSQTINSGWYKERGSSSKTLRIGDSNLMMTGTIRFNESENIFQGFNGDEWVTFNATQGPTGHPGQNASQEFYFTNLPADYDSLTDGPRGEIYSSSGTSNVYLRSIQGGIVDINAGLTSLSLNIENTDDYVKITPKPQPYVWDFTVNNNISYLKSVVTDTKFKAFGKIGKWIVKAGQTIKAGMAVRLAVSINNLQMVIEPFTYGSLNDYNQSSNQTGLGFLGIALENKSAGQSCEVCTEGITTALIGENNSISSKSAIGPGLYAFLNSNGTIFTPSNLTSISSIIFGPGHITANNLIIPIAGYWVENTTLNYYTTGSVANNNLGLFYVNSGLKL